METTTDLSARFKAEEPLAGHTTFRIGGPAELFFSAGSIPEFVGAVNWARNRGTPVFVLGGGSNLLVADSGIRGLVIENQCRAYEVKDLGAGKGLLRAESGAPLPLLANQASRQGWSGLEWGIGIPGTIGGAVVGNAGAHGGSMSDNLAEADVLLPQGERVRWSNSQFGFSYRTSSLKGTRGIFVLSANIALVRDDPQACIARMNSYVEHRRRTQPTQASVGSIFKNPPGQYAGKLIEEAGLKGKRTGDAEISAVHANFIINHGSATAAQVLELIRIVRETVLQKTGTRLELEIQLVGDKG